MGAKMDFKGGSIKEDRLGFARRAVELHVTNRTRHDFGSYLRGLLIDRMCGIITSAAPSAQLANEKGNPGPDRDCTVANTA